MLRCYPQLIKEHPTDELKKLLTHWQIIYVLHFTEIHL